MDEQRVPNLEESAEKTKLNSLSGGLVNGASALRYSAFLADANNNHQEAFQNAIDHIYSSSAAYSKHLDLEGATVNLTGPVSAPIGGPSGTRSIYNGEIRAQAGFAGGDYMLNILGDVPSHYLRLVNLTFNGQTNASWIKWDRGNLVIEACQFKNPKAGATVSTIPAGLYCSDGGAGSNADAGFWINNCWFSTGDAAVQPSDRMTIGILSETGDNKIGGGTTMSYFRHCFIYESFACIIAGLHVFQGVPRDTNMTDHTASIKFTNGRNGSTINGLYLGKSFMEISNETNPTQTKIGEMVITNMRAFMDNGQSNAAHLVARNYGGSTASVQDISVTNCLFVNGGAVQTTPSKLFNPSAFDCNNCKGVLFADNVFKTPSVQPQANPCTLKKTFGFVSTHTFDFTGYLPFAGRPRTLLNATGKRSGGTAQIMEEGAISADTIEVVTPSAWAGDITATVTVNNTQSSGFLDG